MRNLRRSLSMASLIRPVEGASSRETLDQVRRAGGGAALGGEGRGVERSTVSSEYWNTHLENVVDDDDDADDLAHFDLFQQIFPSVSPPKNTPTTGHQPRLAPPDAARGHLPLHGVEHGESWNGLGRERKREREKERKRERERERKRERERERERGSGRKMKKP